LSASPRMSAGPAWYLPPPSRPPSDVPDGLAAVADERREHTAAAPAGCQGRRARGRRRRGRTARRDGLHGRLDIPAVPQARRGADPGRGTAGLGPDIAPDPGVAARRCAGRWLPGPCAAPHPLVISLAALVAAAAGGTWRLPGSA